MFETQATPADLRRRLAKLDQVFDLARLRAQPLAAPEVVDYYEQCHDAYRKYHSAEGAVHMALNDGGRFDADGYLGQVRRLVQGWSQVPDVVLEIGFGQGFNLAWLAERHADTCFLGLDLTPAHCRLAAQRLQRAGLRNVHLLRGDFHHLPLAPASVDAAFSIEVMCHAMDLPQALAEVARVLRPGGRLTLFDGYLNQPPSQMSPDEALAVELVAKGMAIEGLQQADVLLAQAQAVGLRPVAVQVLDAQVMPSLRRLERITGAVIRWPWLGRRALARRPAMRGRNILAGYLLRSSVQLGLMGYRQLVLQKDG